MANIKSIDQHTLLEHCLMQKEWAQKELYELHSAELFPICCRYASDPNEAKDILQEGFIRIFTNLKQYRNEGSLMGWMKRVVITTALNYIKKHRQRLSMEIGDNHHYIADKSTLVTDQISAREVIEAFEQLPYDYRIILGLHIIEGYSSKELSRMFNLEESTCRTKIHRGKKMLQQIILQLNNAIALNK